MAVHRRPVSAALAFLAVLFGVGALSGGPSTTPSGPDAEPVVGSHERAVPLRIADAAVVALLTPGDVVDVVGTDQRGATVLVAREVRVASVPPEAGGSTWTSGDEGLVVVSAEPATALALAGAGSRGPLAVVIHP